MRNNGFLIFAYFAGAALLAGQETGGAFPRADIFLGSSFFARKFCPKRSSLYQQWRHRHSWVQPHEPHRPSKWNWAAQNPAAPSTRLNTSQDTFAMAVGGGLDIKISKLFTVRPIQLDYVLTQLEDLGLQRPS